MCFKCCFFKKSLSYSSRLEFIWVFWISDWRSRVSFTFSLALRASNLSCLIFFLVCSGSNYTRVGPFPRAAQSPLLRRCYPSLSFIFAVFHVGCFTLTYLLVYDDLFRALKCPFTKRPFFLLEFAFSSLFAAHCWVSIAYIVMIPPWQGELLAACWRSAFPKPPVESIFRFPLVCRFVHFSPSVPAHLSLTPSSWAWKSVNIFGVPIGVLA